MKKLMILGIIFLVPLIGVAQKDGKLSYKARIETINFDEADAVFGKVALDAGMSWECCIEEKCDCTDLKDPWEVKKSESYTVQVNSMATSKTAAKIQKDMAIFEKAVLDGKGKTVIGSEVVKNAFAKHPGYSKNAMKLRMDIYIQKMESETEDE